MTISTCFNFKLLLMKLVLLLLLASCLVPAVYPSKAQSARRKQNLAGNGGRRSKSDRMFDVVPKWPRRRAVVESKTNAAESSSPLKKPKQASLYRGLGSAYRPTYPAFYKPLSPPVRQQQPTYYVPAKQMVVVNRPLPPPMIVVPAVPATTASPIQAVPAVGPSMKGGITILTCMGHRYAIPAEAPFYSCCGHKVYYWPNETCSMTLVDDAGEIVNTTTQPPQTVTTAAVNSETTINCDATVYPVPFATRHFYGCCGQLLYDIRTSTCNLNPAVEAVSDNAYDESGSQNVLPNNDDDYDYSPVPLQSNRIIPAADSWKDSKKKQESRLWGDEDLETLAQMIVGNAKASAATGKKVSTTEDEETPPEEVEDSGYSDCDADYLCCENSPPIFNASKRFKCCPGAGPYDPAVSACVLSPP